MDVIGIVQMFLRRLELARAAGIRPLVVLESPYGGNVKENETYARACMLECLQNGEVPIASHLLYTQVLNDTDPEQRAQGIRAGWEWMSVAERVVVYVDYGISPGVSDAIAWARKWNFPIVFRLLGEGDVEGDMRERWLRLAEAAVRNRGATS